MRICGLLILMVCISSASQILYGEAFYARSSLFIGEEHCEVYYNDREVHIDYGEERYSLQSDENKQFLDLTIGDIDGDQEDELLILQGRRGEAYGETLIIYHIREQEGRLAIQETYQNHMEAIKPWRVRICEIDGDGEAEIFIGVHKATRYYENVENRPFFFNFREGVLTKKWTGSKVRGPFTEVYFADIHQDGRDAFIVIEEDKGGVVAAIYYWFGFGFILQAESLPYEQIDSVSVKQIDGNAGLEMKIKEGNQYRNLLLLLSGEKSENGVYLLKERRK